ncbi:MAG: FecR domain-containing protein [Novosphingobium sp.]
MNSQAAIEERAAAWLLRMSDGDCSEACAREFEEWLDASFEHAAAYWRLEHGYEQLDRLLSLPALEAGAEPRRKLPAVSKLLAMAATIAGLVWSGWFLLGDRLTVGTPHVVAYSTQRGQISELTLADGSQVSLDSGTTVRVGTGPDARKVWIDRGRAFFQVSHDRDHPFQVYAGASDIVDLGTKFVVSRNKAVVATSVLEGKVRFSLSSPGNSRALTLTPGKSAIATRATIRPVAGDLRQMRNDLAWREGMVIFEDTPISDAIAEFNRYNQRQLAIHTIKAEHIRIGGKFRFGNIDGFARLMREAYNVDIDILPGSSQPEPLRER